MKTWLSGRKKILTFITTSLQIAKKYFDRVKEKMGEWFITAYVFGSTAKNTARAESDIDIILGLKRPSKEKRRILNSLEGGLFSTERQGLICMTYHEAYVQIFKHVLESEHCIHLSCYYYYHDEEGNGSLWMSGNLFTPYEKLIAMGLQYPHDLID